MKIYSQHTFGLAIGAQEWWVAYDAIDLSFQFR